MATSCVLHKHQSYPINIGMKRFRRSQVAHILCNPVRADQMHRIGLPYINVTGTFSDVTYEGSVDLMLAAAEAYKHLVHPVSYMPNDWIYNKYVEGASYYKLFYDNPDPEIEFTSEFSYDDIDQERFAREQRMHEAAMRVPDTFADINAMRWRMEQIMNKHKKR